MRFLDRLLSFREADWRGGGIRLKQGICCRLSWTFVNVNAEEGYTIDNGMRDGQVSSTSEFFQWKPWARQRLGQKKAETNEGAELEVQKYSVV